MTASRTNTWRVDRARARVVAAAGLCGAATVVVLAALAHTFAPRFAFPPIAMSQVLVRTPPGGFDSFFIDLLGHWAQRLAVVATCLAFLVAGVPLGALAAALRRRPRLPAPLAGALAFAPIWFAALVLYPQSSESLSRWAYAAGLVPIVVAGGAVAGRLLERWQTRRADGASGIGTRPTDVQRRAIVRAATVGVAGLALGAFDLGRIVRRPPDPGARSLDLPSLTPAPPLPPSAERAVFDRIPGLSPLVTSIATHYVVDEEIIDPVVDPSTWRLGVSGSVRRPLSLSYDQLRTLPAVERYQTLECISNEVGGDLISTARWAGIPLRTILERAGIGGGAVEVIFRAVGGYSDSLPVEQAMEESTLVAIGMNGRVLPRAHGFPARLLSSGTFGMKNPKWLVGIEAVDRPYQGFWEQRGWSKPAIVRTMSRIDTPPSGVSVGSRIAVAGIAFAGNRGISRVEVSTDGGRSWREATLEPELSSLTWRRWRFTYVPTRRGQTTLLARAVDGRGTAQPAAPAQPFPLGSSGYDAIVATH